MTTFRRLLYTFARLLGDAQAIRTGRIAQRLANKWLGRKVVSRLWR